MKKKIFTWTGIVILVLLVAILVIPIAFKGKIVEIVNKEANKNLNAVLKFDNHIRLSLIRNFPNLTVEVHQIVITNKAPFDGDTLVNLGDFKATLDIMSVFRGDKIRISTVSIDNARIYLHILKNGKSNWDITLPDTSQAKKPADTVSNFKMSLKKYTINNTTVTYNDESSGMIFKINGMNHSGKGDFTSDIYDLNTNTEMTAFTFTYGGVDYIHRALTKLDAVININMKENKYTFKDNLLKLNDFFLKFDGFVALQGNDINMDLKFNAQQTDFKNLISLIPAMYSSDFKDIQTSGKMAFNGYMKGIYNDKSFPGFDVTMNVSNGMFRYPSLPAAVDNVNLDVNVKCPDGNFDHTTISMNNLHFELDKEPFSARLLVRTPVSDPFIDAGLKGNIDLGKVRSFIPLDKGTTLQGNVNADVTMKGNLSVIEKNQYEKFNASGKISCTNLLYAGPEVPQKVEVPSLVLLFSPKAVTLQNMNMVIGKNDLQATGQLTNFIAYFFGKGILGGELNLHSNLLDLNTLLSSSSSATNAKTDTSASFTAPELPGNIDFTMNSKIGRLVYDKVDATNIQCQITLKDKILSIKNMSMNVLSGSMQIANSTYDSRNIKKPKVVFQLVLKNFDIQKTLVMFPVVSKYVPIARYGSGSYDAKLTVTSDLLKTMKPDLATFFSNGNLDIQKITVSGFKPVEKIADAIKMEKFKTMTVQNIHPSYEIKAGIFTLKPINFKVEGTDFTVDGTNGLDKTMNYNIKAVIPSSQLNNTAKSTISNLSDNKLNVNLGETVTVFMKVTGTIDDPKVQASLGKIKENVKQQVKQQAKQEVEKQKEQVKQQAKQEVTKQKEQIKEKGKEEVQNQKKNLEDQAKKKLKKIF